jgi:hypothetical protein
VPIGATGSKKKIVAVKKKTVTVVEAQKMTMKMPTKVVVGQAGQPQLEGDDSMEEELAEDEEDLDEDLDDDDESSQYEYVEEEDNGSL